MRRLARWVRDVTLERGEHAAVPVALERDGHGGYAFRLGLRAGFGGEATARIPVSRRTNPAPHPILKELHSCEVAGSMLEAANVHALMAKVSRLLEGIAPARVLPLCYFRAPAMDYEVPVYEEDGRVVSPVIGGPRLRARDLAGIRLHITRYLQSAGYVGDADEIEVGVVRPSDLRRVAPAAVFRSWAEPELWLPSVEGVSDEGPVVGALAHGFRLERAERPRAGAGLRPRPSAPAAPDVLALLRSVRAELGRAGHTRHPEAIYAAEVRPEIWAVAEARTEDTGTRLVAYLTDEDGARLELTVRRTGAGDVATALEDRHINAFLTSDEHALAAAVGRHLQACGYLRFAEEVQIQPAGPPRAERLDADAIRTLGGSLEVAAAPAPEPRKEEEPSWQSA